MPRISLPHAFAAPARFDDPGTERQFLREFRATGLDFTRCAVTFGAAIALVFFALMLGDPGNEHGKPAMQGLRLLLAGGLGLIAWFYVRHRDWSISHYEIAVSAPMLLASLVIAALGVSLRGSMDADASGGRLALSMVLCCWLCYGFMRMPVAIASTILAPASAFTATMVASGASEHPGATALYLVLANAIGWVLSIEVERRERALFWRTRQLARASEAIARHAIEASRSSAAKSHLLAAVSHDLRQPLASLSLGVAHLREPRFRLERPLLLARVARMQECLDAMAGNLGRLSEIARLQDRARRLPVRPTPVAPLFERAAGVFPDLAQRHRVRLVIHVPPPGLLAHTNLERMWDVLSNLIDNAIKFAAQSPRRQPWVVVRAAVRRGVVRIDVRDNGPGIAAEHHRRVFDEYFQVDNRGRDRQHGYGLGLAIARETIANLPGHRIGLRSRCGAGARFSVDLPDARAESAMAESAPDRRRFDHEFTQELTGARVLLILEDAALRDAIGDRLSRWGLLLDRADGPAQAADRARQAERPFDAVLVAEGPRTDAVAVVDAVRRVHGLPVPAIVFGAVPEGMTRVIRLDRPPQPAELGAALARAVALSSAMSRT